MKTATLKWKTIHWNSGDVKRAERGMGRFLKESIKNKPVNQ